jgi:hypothetical protein
MDASVGYLAVNNSGRVLGSVFVNKLIERYVLALVEVSLMNTACQVLKC